MWEIAQPRNKKFKFFLQGPPGCFKTRVALRLANNGNFKNPSAGAIDTEFGTDHYAKDFAFRRLQENDPVIIDREVKKLVKNPGDIRTLIMDSFSVYYDALMELWVDRFQLREKTSAGNKGEYYTLQPRDYVHINRDAAKLVRTMLKCDLNVICITQIKEKWENMKVVGSIFDGWKRLPYYFDTIIGIEEIKGKWKAQVLGKDRSHSFKVGEIIPWENDEQIVEYITKKIGGDLSGGAKAQSYDPDALKPAKETNQQPDQKDHAGQAASTNEKHTEPSPDDSSAAAPAASEQSSASTKETDEKPAESADKAGEQEQGSQPENSGSGTEDKDTSGPVTRDKLIEVAREKKAAKINDPAVWEKVLEKFKVKTAKDLTMNQADELIGDLIRGEIPTTNNTGT